MWVGSVERCAVEAVDIMDVPICNHRATTGVCGAGLLGATFAYLAMYPRWRLLPGGISRPEDSSHEDRSRHVRDARRGRGRDPPIASGGISQRIDRGCDA